MKRFLATTAFVLATAGGALAASDMDAVQLRIEVADFLATQPFTVEMMSLTDEQVAALYGAITGTDNESERDAKVRAILTDANVVIIERSAYITVPRDQIYVSVKNELTGTEYETMVPFLTDEQLVTAYSILNSTDSDSEKHQKIAAVFN